MRPGYHEALYRAALDHFDADEDDREAIEQKATDIRWPHQEPPEHEAY